MKKKIKIGDRFKKMVILEDLGIFQKEGTSSRRHYVRCKCDCGQEKVVNLADLKAGRIQSCGCYRVEQLKKVKQDISEEYMLGRRYGKLVVQKRSEKKSPDGAIYWFCLCDCGNIVEVQGRSLRRKDGNQTISCGCFHRSIGALNIYNCLSKNNITFIDEYSFHQLPKSRFDFAIIENGKITRLIEFDGEQHFKDIPAWGGLELQQQRDKIKNEYALSHNIPLVRIPYWERDNITIEMINGDKYLVR